MSTRIDKLVADAIEAIVSGEASADDMADFIMDATTTASVSGFIAGGFVDPTGKRKFKAFGKTLTVKNGEVPKAKWEGSVEERMDGTWKTINGTHVHISGGKITKGPSALKHHSHKQARARGRFTRQGAAPTKPKSPKPKVKAKTPKTKKPRAKKDTGELGQWMRSDHIDREGKVKLIHKATGKVVHVHKDDPRHVAIQRVRYGAHSDPKTWESLNVVPATVA